MSTAVRVALVGFTPFVHASFDTFFRLATRHHPMYLVVATLRECDVIVANADDAARMAELAQRGVLARTLSIGTVAPQGVAHHQPRPINMMQLVSALDALLPRLLAVSPSVQRVLDDFATITQHADHADGNDGADDTVALGLAGPRQRELDHILVIDHSDEALRFMVRHLERFGFQVALARSSDEALQRVARRHHAFVFVDADMPDVDGYLLCQAIKRHAHSGEGLPPTVVMMARECDVVTAARSGLAGSDACIAKPLCEQDLLRVMGGREVHDHAYADTADRVRSMF